MSKAVKVGFGLAVPAVVILAINLRAGISSLAPVIGQVADALGINSSTAGILTALPGFCFAAMGWCAVPLARKFGVSPTLLAGGFALVVGLAIRPFLDNFLPFLILTVLLIAGIAVANILLPAWIKEHSGGRNEVRLMMIYTALAGMSGAIGPLSALLFSGSSAWRWSLGVWVVPAIIQVLVWFIVLSKTKRDVLTADEEPVEQELSEEGEATEVWPEKSRANPKASMFKSFTAVAMMLFFGIQSSMAYAQMGWLPAIMVDDGVNESTASISLAVVGAFNIFGGILMPWVITRFDNVVPVPIILGIVTLAGWLGIMFIPTAAPLLWASLLGIGGMCFPLILALLTARTRSPMVTARLSGFVQPTGYIVAGITPLLMGFLFASTGSWKASLILVSVMSVGLIVFGVRAARNIYIDDELV